MEKEQKQSNLIEILNTQKISSETVSRYIDEIYVLQDYRCLYSLGVKPVIFLNTL